MVMVDLQLLGDPGGEVGWDHLHQHCEGTGVPLDGKAHLRAPAPR